MKYLIVSIIVLVSNILNVKADDVKVIHEIEFNRVASKELIKTFFQELKYYNDPLPKEVNYEKFDLNSDKIKEYFFFLYGNGWCGTGNCPIKIFSTKRNIKKIVLEASSSAPIYILKHKTNGYHDITFYPITEENKYIWRWDGEQYR